MTGINIDLASHLINISSDNEHTTLQNNNPIMKTNEKNKNVGEFQNLHSK